MEVKRKTPLAPGVSKPKGSGFWESALSRRGILMGAASLAAARLMPGDDRDAAVPSLGPPYVYVGCYTGGSGGRGISVYHIDVQTNQLTLANIVGPVNSPSFIVLDPAKKFLYSGNEGGGSVSAFSINPQTGDLRFLNTQSASGSPAHVATDRSIRWSP